jgi:hypothetical protein
VNDPDKSGSTDAGDVQQVMADMSGTPENAASDVTQDAAVDGDDAVVVTSQLGRTNVIEYTKAAQLIYGHIGLMAGAVDTDVYGWHTAQTEAACGGFGGENWPDDDLHYLRTSNNYPPTSEHAVLLSQAYPPNHMISVTRQWPDPEYTDPFIGPPVYEWPDPVENWPTNHYYEASESWDDHWPAEPPEHREYDSVRWRYRRSCSRRTTPISPRSATS